MHKQNKLLLFTFRTLQGAFRSVASLLWLDVLMKEQMLSSNLKAATTQEAIVKLSLCQVVEDKTDNWGDVTHLQEFTVMPCPDIRLKCLHYRSRWSSINIVAHIRQGRNSTHRNGGICNRDNALLDLHRLNNLNENWKQLHLRKPCVRR